MLRIAPDDPSWSALAQDAVPVILSGAAVQAPSLVLPIANAMPVYDRWAKWSVMSTEGCGRCVDQGGVCQAALDQIPWKVLVLGKDNLQLNMCLVCLQERNIAGAPEDSPIHSMSLIDFKCAAHSVVLATKPLIASTGVSSILVKLGHIFESARCHTAYLHALDSEVEASFHYSFTFSVARSLRQMESTMEGDYCKVCGSPRL